jgi:hypothetical protein
MRWQAMGARNQLILPQSSSARRWAGLGRKSIEGPAVGGGGRFEMRITHSIQCIGDTAS